MMYQGFASIYDALMKDVDYQAWAAYYMELAGRCGVQVRRAADCACGTGGLTLPLAARGIDITGLDRSEEMLRAAMEKARKAGKRIPFVRQDMRTLALHKSVDAVFCGCDGVNYLTSLEDVLRFFQAAYRALPSGGGLFFDISSAYKLEHVLGNRCLGQDENGLAYLWFNHYDAAKKILQMDLSFFVREADGRYSRFAETHFQRAHSQEEIFKALMQAGFEKIQVFGDQTFERPQDACQRLHFAAVR